MGIKLPRIKRDFYYLVFKHEGRMVVWLIPDCQNDAEAHRKGFEKLQGTIFEVVKRNYNDTGRVTQEMKARNLDSTGDIESSLRRAKHKLPDIPPE